MNNNKVINPPEEEEESSEFESEKIDSPHPSELIESNNKEKIYSEYLKNKNYFSPEEKKILKKYRKIHMNHVQKINIVKIFYFTTMKLLLYVHLIQKQNQQSMLLHLQTELLNFGQENLN